MDDFEKYKQALLEIAKEVHSLVFGYDKDKTLLRRLQKALRDLARQEKKHLEYMKRQSVISSYMLIPDEYKSLVTKYFKLDKRYKPPLERPQRIIIKDEKGEVSERTGVQLDGVQRELIKSPPELPKEELKKKYLIGLACIYDNCQVSIGKPDKINDSIVNENTYNYIWKYIYNEYNYYDGIAEFWKTALDSIRPRRKQAETKPQEKGKQGKNKKQGVQKRTKPKKVLIRDQVFICYSHKDKKWLDELQIHLKPYIRNGLITAWSDKQIEPGSKWFAEIKTALTHARVAVLLVTPNFIASDFIHEHELAPLLKDTEKGNVRIIWIPVRTCSYKETPLKNYQAAIDPQKALAKIKKANRDEAWVKICEVIKEAVNC